MQARGSKGNGVAISEVGILRFRRRISATSRLEMSYDDVRRAVGTCLPLVLSELAEGGKSSTERVKVGLRTWLPKVAVEPEVSSATRARQRAAGHIHWHAIRLRRLFPEMEADVFVRPMGSRNTRLVLDATYRPPGGLPGIVADLLVGRLIARSTLAAFTARLTEAMATATEQGRCGADLGHPFAKEAA